MWQTKDCLDEKVAKWQEILTNLYNLNVVSSHCLNWYKAIRLAWFA